METASPLRMPKAMKPLAAASTMRWNSPVVICSQRPGPVLRVAMTVSSPVRSMRWVSREYRVSSLRTSMDPGVVYSVSMYGP